MSLTLYEYNKIYYNLIRYNHYNIFLSFYKERGNLNHCVFERLVENGYLLELKWLRSQNIYTISKDDVIMSIKYNQFEIFKWLLEYIWNVNLIEYVFVNKRWDMFLWLIENNYDVDYEYIYDNMNVKFTPRYIINIICEHI